MESNVILSDTVEASGAIAARRAVTFAGAQATTLGEKVFGISDTNANDGEPLALSVMGFVMVQSGGPISPATIWLPIPRAAPSSTPQSVASTYSPRPWGPQAEPINSSKRFCANFRRNRQSWI